MKLKYEPRYLYFFFGNVALSIVDAITFGLFIPIHIAWIIKVIVEGISVEKS